ncbi:hypothetical protein H2199_005364 [Coniosporium tulheliwenetii]|uniref:Uncharacterized protein n=1 Tax=Coniosporium tulheliwenetii TaxID=3383036 RepID=A0ACC2Z2C7_9PEZI|nr:hypothetical protein H2199_005364 [Cladosporium sp. JES 115]
MDNFLAPGQSDHNSLERYTLSPFAQPLVRPSTSTPLPHGGRPLPVEPPHFLDQTLSVPHGIHNAVRGSEQKQCTARLPKSAVPLAEVLNNEAGPPGFGGSLHDILDDTSARKRMKLDGAELLTLPKPHPPPKKGTRRRIPPLLQGLHQPPPDAGLFPPISSEPPVKKDQVLPVAEEAVLETSAKVVVNVQDAESQLPPPVDADAKKPSKARKRRRWTEQETNDLLCGVAKFGIGSWKKILSHPEYSFQDRSAVDLKDRFRVCRPDDYRKLDTVDLPKTAPPTAAQSASAATERVPVKVVSNLISSNILQPCEPETCPSKPEPCPPDRKHRKGAEDLLRIGIEEPFRKSSHRERRAFTEEEDAALLQGYEKHGPHWKAIRDDPELGLSSRRHPLDLRDRFRNRFPEKYTEAGYKLLRRVLCSLAQTTHAPYLHPAHLSKPTPKPFAFWSTHLPDSTDFDFLSEPTTTSSPIILNRDILDFTIGTLPQLPLGLPSLVRPSGPGPGTGTGMGPGNFMGPGPPLVSLLHTGSGRAGQTGVNLPPLADLGSGVDAQPAGYFLEELPALRSGADGGEGERN